MSQSSTTKHQISPRLSSKTSPPSLSDHQTPYQSIKNHPKHLLKLTFNTPKDDKDLAYYRVYREYKTDIHRLKKVTKLLQNAKNLAHLSLPLFSITSFDLSYSLSRLKYLQNLSSLNLNIICRDHLKSMNIENLAHALASLKNLTSFTFAPPERYHVPLQLINSVLLALRSLNSLKHLSFIFYYLKSFGDEHLKQLAFHLRKLPQLQSLTFSADACSDITNTGLQLLSPVFKNLPLLSDVTIRLLRSRGGSSVSTISSIFSGLATLKLLKKLDISLEPDSDCNLKKTEPFSLGLDMLDASLLREISLKIYNRFEDYGLTQLSKSLTRFSSLEALIIDFSNEPPISDKGLSHFSSALKTLKSLSTLALPYLGSCQSRCPDKLIALISEGIAPLIQLQNLTLDFENSCDNDSSVKSLSKNIRKVKFLKKLDLNLSECIFLDDDAVSLISKRLGELQELTHLTLDLTSIEELTDEGFESFVASFCNFSKLTHLSLKFDIEGLKILANGITNLPALYSLNLDFHSIVMSENNEEFGAICEALENCSSLRKVFLHMKSTDFAQEKIRKLEKIKDVTMAWIYPAVKAKKARKENEL